MSSSAGEKGTGVCGAVTVLIGALRIAEGLLGHERAMSAAIEHRGCASSTTTSRPVSATLSRIVSVSSGEVVRGSITVTPTPLAA